MTKVSLNPDQRRTVQMVEALDFGVIERLLIRGGVPCYEQLPRIVQTIKLAPQSGRQPHHHDADLSLNKAFENLFDQLGRLPDGFVDIEVQHSLPFRLVLERRYEDLL
jgi:hypothetical protein